QDVITTALGGETVTTTVEGRERYGVNVRYPRELRSDPQAATFDLPAYRELLFLYSVARDLAERQAGQPPVDLLLPFGDDVPPAPAVVEPLMATRPVKAQPSAQPPLVVDFTLDDIEPADAVPPNTPITPPPSAPSASAPPDTGPIEFEHIDIPKKSG
ncbi:MAG: hypothetical protein MK041_11595, partial [Aquabacterium sp.]|nr:hypothetical protein [Aquabacterium sp.]